MAKNPLSKTPIIALIQRLASRLRFPHLFWLTAGLFVLNLFVLDPIPFIDEILLGLLTVMLGSLTGDGDEEDDEEVEEEQPPMKDVTPRG